MQGRIALQLSLALCLTGFVRLAVATPVSSCTAQTVRTVLAQAYPGSTAPYRIDRHRLACTVRNAHAWLAVPLIESQPEDEGISDGDLEILAADPATGKLLERMRLKGRMDEDAISVDRLTFSSARYRLARGAPAIGLIIERANGSIAAFFTETELSLFMLDRGKLRLLVNGLVTSRMNSAGIGCSIEATEFTTKIHVSGAAHLGMHDLDVEGVTSDSTSGMRNGACATLREKHTNREQTLTYDGTSYRVPKRWRTFVLN